MDKAAPSGEAARAAPPSSVRPTPAVALAGAIDRIADDVRAGRVSRADAVQRVVESTLDALLPAGTPPTTREVVRELLATKLDIDPTLRARLVGLSLTAPGTTENP